MKNAYGELFKTYPDVVDVEGLCEMLGGISKKLAYRLLSEGAIKAVKIGRTYKIPKVYISEYLLCEIMRSKANLSSLVGSDQRSGDDGDIKEISDAEDGRYLLEQIASLGSTSKPLCGNVGVADSRQSKSCA